MKTISVQYSPGLRSVTVTGAYQYDHGVEVEIHGLTTSAQPDLQFGIDGISTTISVVATKSGNTISAEIPDVMLSQPRLVCCYVYVESATSGYTSFEIRIPITPRPKPSDYTATSQQISNFNALLAQLNASIEEASDLKNAATNMDANVKKAAASATTAQNAASTAQAAANNAAQSERNIVSQVTGVQGAVDQVESSAKSARDAAATAQAAASKAEEAASGVLESADEVLAHLGEAQETANQAMETANRAQEITSRAQEIVAQVEGSVADAEAASTQAQGFSTTAQTAANNAASHVSRAQEMANLAASSAGNAQTSALSASQAARAGADAAVEAEEYAQQANASSAEASSVKEELTSALELVEAMQDNMLIMPTMGGSIVSVPDAAETSALSLISSIKPTTEGVTSITLTRTGANLFDNDAENVEEISYTNTSGAAATVKGRLLSLPAGSYCASAEYISPSSQTDNYITTVVVDAQLQAISGTSTALVSGASAKAISFHLEEGQKLLMYNASTAQSLALTKTKFKRFNIMIVPGAKHVAYEPYVCETMVTELPETIYGGSFDWLTGTLTATRDSAGELLESPAVYKAEAYEFSMLYGYNNIWSTTGDTEMTYLANIKLYVDNRSVEVSTGGSSGGDVTYAENAGYAEEAGDAQTVMGVDVVSRMNAMDDQIAKNEEAAAKLTEEKARTFSGYDEFYAAMGRMRVNADTPLDIPTYDGSNAALHPKVLYFADGFAGHKYWMAFTPYPADGEQYENPSIAYSDDGDHWSVDGISNPIDATPTDGYNSDTHLVFANGYLECWWRQFCKMDNGAVEVIYRKKSANGVDWSNEEELFRVESSSKCEALCPVVIYEDGIYKIWVAVETVGLKYYESSDGANWVYIRDINVDNPDYPNHKVWHFDIIHTAAGYEYVGNYRHTGNNDLLYIYYAVSKDNVTYDNFALILTPGETGSFDSNALYRPCILRFDNKVVVYYAGRKEIGTWKIAKIEAPSPYLFSAVLKNGQMYQALSDKVEALDPTLQFVSPHTPIAVYSGSYRGDEASKWAEIAGGASISLAGCTWSGNAILADGVNDSLMLPLSNAKSVVIKMKLQPRGVYGYVFDCRDTVNAYCTRNSGGALSVASASAGATVYIKRQQIVPNVMAADYVNADEWGYFTIVFNDPCTGNMRICSHNGGTFDYLQAEIAGIKVYDVDVTI